MILFLLNKCRHWKLRSQKFPSHRASRSRPGTEIQMHRIDCASLLTHWSPYNVQNGHRDEENVRIAFDFTIHLKDDAATSQARVLK